MINKVDVILHKAMDKVGIVTLHTGMDKVDVSLHKGGTE